MAAWLQTIPAYENTGPASTTERCATLRPSASQEVYHPLSTYLKKAPTAQLTCINASDRLFSVPLTRITSVPECAVSSVGFLWGSGTVSRRCGVSVGSPRPLAGSADRRGVPRYRGFRTPMTTFLVTQRHRCHRAACDNSAPIRNAYWNSKHM
jgi:hypothetical protein